VEHDDPAAHDRGEAAEDDGRLGIRQVMHAVDDHRPIETCIARQRVELHQLEAAARRRPAPARERDVAGVEVDAQVAAGYGGAESSRTAAKIEDAGARLGGELGIGTIRIVIGDRGEVVRRYLGDGAHLGVRITYVHNPRLDLELPYSIYLASRELRDRCCVILADECYVDTNHRDLLHDA